MSETMFNGLVELAVGDLATALTQRDHMTPAEALGRVYHSDFYRRLCNKKSGLYLDGPASLYHLFQQEQNARSLRVQETKHSVMKGVIDFCSVETTGLTDGHNRT